MADSGVNAVVNTDPGVQLRVESSAMPWLPSHMPGISWKVFEHNGNSPARYTALLNWPGGIATERHVHDDGEEMLILEGSFCDEFGEYGPGTYLRNPHESAHLPATKDGCIMLAKQRLMGPGDDRRIAIDTGRTQWLPSGHDGMSVMPLHRHGAETVTLVKLERGFQQLPHRHVGGKEIFVVSGSFSDEFGLHPRGTWLRYPVLSAHEPASAEGCVLYVKSGHLSSPWRLVRPPLHRD